MRTPITHVIAITILSATFAAAIPPPRLPLHKPIHEEPNLLTDYERKTLQLEMNTLTSEIAKARHEATQSSSIKAKKKTLQDAEEKKDAKLITSAQRMLADKVETLLLAQEGMPEKIKRLLEVGRFLEYDSQFKKDDRRRKGTLYKRLRTQPARSNPNP